jgi:hypothetical protein
MSPFWVRDRLKCRESIGRYLRWSHRPHISRSPEGVFHIHFIEGGPFSWWDRCRPLLIIWCIMSKARCTGCPPFDRPKHAQTAALPSASDHCETRHSSELNCSDCEIPNDIKLHRLPISSAARSQKPIFTLFSWTGICFKTRRPAARPAPVRERHSCCCPKSCFVAAGRGGEASGAPKGVSVSIGACKEARLL